MITAGSLFSGIGGMDLAFSLAGFDIRWQIEINGFCRKVLQKHSWEYWRNATQFTDVRRVTARTGRGWRRYQQLERVDVLFGGFPCQDISISGNKAGIQEGTRSGLWSEFRRLIGEIRPRAVLLENAPNITRIDGTIVVADLTAMGYDARWGIISAEDAQAPHVRERWWCIAFPMGDTHSQRYAGQEPTRSLHQNKEWNYQAGEQTGRHQLHEVIRDGEMEYAYSERRETEIFTSVSRQARYVDWEHGSSGVETSRLVPQSRMGRNADGLPARLDGTRLMALEYPAPPNQAQYSWEPPRVAPKGSNTGAQLESLGNAVVPQVVYPIAVELHEVLRKFM